MTRKHRPRRAIVPMPPRGLRLPIGQARRVTIGLVLHELLDAIAAGQATEQTLIDLAEATFTWTRVAELLATGQEEMLPQLHLATRLVERYGNTGHVQFEGAAEYELARQGVQVMEALAEAVDQPTAVVATHWSEAQMVPIRHTMAQRAARRAA